ncbi:DUF4349 domain-containing protein [Phycicoccus sonneratiae]|uniref:DUF4349 domain-containing protein n=1 Tax=Phycicoccus sonneratiae TaxID=2807628 RepID=A0ABS2CIR3_9MICO|nr:DUF4349 domain-containing protein [Phycicoccus sonneraticus]MBM6399768.1 DUF4349 domain-containing protein [Phycicoccus sonneraticus]
MRATSRPPAHRVVAPLLAGALAMTLLGACGAGDSGAASDAAGGASSEQSSGTARQDLAAPSPATASGTDEKAGTTSVAAAVAARKLARRADVALQVKDVARAASTLRAVAAQAGGLVVSEEVSSDPSAAGAAEDSSTDARTAWGTITISVPTEKLDATLDQVAKVGTVLSRQSSTEDVTGQYVDTAARVQTMKASVERVRTLMAKADKLADVVSLEAELSRRQADLEAMEQQLAALDDQVTLSPVTIRLSTDADALAPQEDPTGFVAGLAAGWGAFTTSVRLVLTLLGALLPFAVAAAVVLVPLALWWRRRRVTVSTPATPPPAAPAA